MIREKGRNVDAVPSVEITANEMATVSARDVSLAPDVAHYESVRGSVRVLRPRRAGPADAVRPTRAEVNLAHLRHNYFVLERTLGEAAGAHRPAAIWGVLKADAYGHGA